MKKPNNTKPVARVTPGKTASAKAAPASKVAPAVTQADRGKDDEIKKLNEKVSVWEVCLNDIHVLILYL